MSKKIEQLLEYLLAKDTKKAKQLVRQVFIEKARKIHEEIMNREDEEFDTIGGDEGDSLERDVRRHNNHLKTLSDEIETEETMYEDEDMEDADMDMEDADADMEDADMDLDDADMEDADADMDDADIDMDDADADMDDADVDMDVDMQDDMDMDDEDMEDTESDISDTIGDLEDALAELKAEFERLESDSDEDSDEDSSMDDEESDEDSESDMDEEDMDESWFSENYDELAEALELDTVSVPKAGEVGSGKYSSDFDSKDTSPIAKSQTSRMGAMPIKIDDKKKSGFDRESAPMSKSMDMTNRRKKSMDGMSKMSKEGDAAALINKTSSEFGADTVGKNSPLTKAPRK